MVPTIRAVGSRNKQKKSAAGQSGKVPRRKSINNSKQTVESSGIKKASHPKNDDAPSSKTEEKTKKTQSSSSQTEPQLIDDQPVYHITWEWDDGLDEECEPLGQNCPLCNKDLIYMPSGEDESDYYNYFEYVDELELPKHPEVAVLSCGHAFHSECLLPNTSEEHSRDPPCFLCFSYF